jgi:hypothetical protein
MRNKILLLFIVVFTIVGILFLTQQTFYNIKIDNFNNQLNYQFKPIIQQSNIIQPEIKDYLNPKLFDDFALNIEVVPMTDTHIFTTYFTTTYPPTMENLIAVDAKIDNGSKNITITTYINTKYLNTKDDIERAVNRNIITGLLYAQSLLNNQSMTAELQNQILNNTDLIYNDMLQSQNNWIIYEE